MSLIRVTQVSKCLFVTPATTGVEPVLRKKEEVQKCPGWLTVAVRTE